ncbi:MAG: T9SS type A sorting domain-containing protein [Bacteroidota bacterium]|nr:T9SS type A sorting domain-containing protein [Bacteroidota bacterium]
MQAHRFCLAAFPWLTWDSNAIAANHTEWVGSGDSSKGKPFDTTMNTMHELGLDFLDSLKLDAHPSGAPASTYLLSLSVNPNPSESKFTAIYSLARQGFIHACVFDVLGRVLWERRGESEAAGDHELPLDLRSFPSGSYYLRLEAGIGDVKTVKLIHE